MSEISPAGFHLAATWPQRLGTLIGAAGMLLLAAAGLGVSVLFLIIITAALTHGYISWVLLGDLLLAVIGGLVTVYAARAAARMIGRTFAVLPAAYAELPSGSIEPSICADFRA